MAADEQIIEQAQREARINELDEVLGKLRDCELHNAGGCSAIKIVEKRQQELIREREEAS